MSTQKHAGLTRIIKAFGYSLAGLKAAYASEAAFRQELLLLAIGIPAACMLEFSPMERALMIGSLLLVLMVEIINAALEATIDRISSELHPISKKAKDLGSAAVLISLVNAGLIWAILLFS